MTLTVQKAMVRMAILFSVPGLMLATTEPIWCGVAMLTIGVMSLTLYVLSHEED